MEWEWEREEEEHERYLEELEHKRWDKDSLRCTAPLKLDTF